MVFDFEKSSNREHLNSRYKRLKQQLEFNEDRINLFGEKLKE